MAIDNPTILKELELKNSSFNLKSKTTGKYSVQDSYRENYTSGFLQAINAPQDVNLALKDIYYATEKGLIVSYREFNSKIVANRKLLMEKNFPNKDIKDLAKEERIKIETESAKIVLRELGVNESAKLIYSTELTTLRDGEYKNSPLKFIPSELKVCFLEPIKTEEDLLKEEEEKREKLIDAFLTFSEDMTNEFEPIIDCFNLDEIELGLLSLQRKFDNLDELFKENESIIDLYENTKLRLENQAEEMKENQDYLEKNLSEKVDDLFERKAFKEIKGLIEQITQDFIADETIANDPKSISIKDFAIQRLTEVGKVIALVGLENWEEVNFKTAEELLSSSLPKYFEDILHKKAEQQKLLKEENEQKLSEIDLTDNNSIYAKLLELSDKKFLFNRFFDLITKDNYQVINLLIDKLDNELFNFITLLGNTLKNEKFANLFENLSYEVVSKLTAEDFNYEGFSKVKSKNLFINTLVEKGTQERIELVFNKILASTVRRLDIDILAKALLKLRNFGFELEALAEKILPETLLELGEKEELKRDNYIRNTIIRTLLKWFSLLDVTKPLFEKIIRKYPQEAVYKLSKKKAEKMDLKLIVEIFDLLESKNKSDLEQFVLRVGMDNIQKLIEFKLKQESLDNPNNFDNHYNLGVNYFNGNNFENAIFEFKKCIGISPENHLGYYNLGLAYERSGRYDLAINQYKKATQLKFSFNDGYYSLGSLYLSIKEPFLAAQQFKKIQKNDPENYDACVSLGIAYEDMNEVENALIEYDKAIQINPDKTDAFVNKAICFSSKGMIDEAIELLDSTLELDPKNAKVQFNLGLLYQQKGEKSVAMAHYKVATKFDPNNSQAYNNLGLLYFSKVKLKEAAKMWEKAIEIDNNIDAYNNLGWNYYVSQEFEKSIEVYKKAKLVNPNHAVLSMNLGTVYYRVGEEENAIKEFETFLELEPNSDSAHEVAKILKQIKENG